MPRTALRDMPASGTGRVTRELQATEAERQRHVYETLLGATPDFVYMFGLDHRILYANEALLAMWGRTRDDTLGHTFLEIGYEPWHAAMHEREIDSVRDTRLPVRGVVPFTGTHGRRHYEYIFVPVLAADGSVEAVAGTTRDITERVQAEEQLRASEARQRFLVQLTDALRPMADPVAIQAEATRLLGERLGVRRVVYFEVRDGDYVVEQEYAAGVPSIIGRYPMSAFGPAIAELLANGTIAVEDDVSGHSTRSWEEMAAFSAIQIRSLAAVPLFKDGVLIAGVAACDTGVRSWSLHDITIIEDAAERIWAAVERARADVALRQSEERSAFVRRSSGVGFWYCDLPFDVLQWDDLVKAHFFLPASATVTIDTFYARIHPDDRERTREAIALSITERTPYQIDYRTVDPGSGTVRWVRAIGRTFYAADGTPKQFDGITLDVTEQKRAEASQDEFLAILAHELRNPLAPIRNGLHVIRLSQVDEQVARMSAMMERQLSHLVHLVDDLLDVSRVRSDKLTLRLGEIDLRTTVEAALESSRPLVDEAGHTLSVSLPACPVPVQGDVTRLAQVIANLLNNSAKYTPRGGHIRLALSCDGTHAIVSVRDNGIGIPRSMLEKVFERFTQVDRSLEKTTGGLGIGLSLVKGLVEMHGGSVEARSAGEGAGSEFIVRIPLAGAGA